LIISLVIFSCSREHLRTKEFPDKKNNALPGNVEKSDLTAGSRKDIDKTLGQNSIDIAELKKFSGSYKTYINSFEGIINIYFDESKGRISGTIKFFKWGTEESEEMKDLRINNNKLYFIRSITSVEEQKKFGGNRYFVQKFYGEFFNNGNEIRGQYVEAGTESLWRAAKNKD